LDAAGLHKRILLQGFNEFGWTTDTGPGVIPERRYQPGAVCWEEQVGQHTELSSHVTKAPAEGLRGSGFDQQRGESFAGRFYTIDGPLEPLWGSDAGLHRAAWLGDGWLASAYNITPAQFALSWRRVRELLDQNGRDPAGFGNGLATMWFHIDGRRAKDVLDKRLAPVVHRRVEQLRERLAFGAAAAVAEKLAAFRDSGVQLMFLWPVTDEIEQLQQFHDEVMPRMDA
jgi:hypothetical protein